MKRTHRFTSMLFVVLAAAVICTGLEVQPSASAQPLPSSAKADDFNGYYVLYHEGEGPAGFKSFAAIELTTMRHKPSGSMPIKPYGVVYAGRKYKMERIDIVGDTLSFETVNLAGVTYQFNGRLVRPYKPDGPAFSGRLIKTVNGKKAAEAQVDFYIEEGG